MSALDDVIAEVIDMRQRDGCPHRHADAARAELAALRQRCDELDRVLRLVAPHIGFTLPLEATRSLAAEARKALRGDTL